MEQKKVFKWGCAIICFIVIAALVYNLTQLTTMEMRVQSEEFIPFESDIEQWDAYGSFHNKKELSVIRVRKVKIVGTSDAGHLKQENRNVKDDENTLASWQRYRALGKRNSPEFIGEHTNYSVTIRTSFWDSVISVLSLGYYAPFDIECQVVKASCSGNGEK